MAKAKDPFPAAPATRGTPTRTRRAGSIPQPKGADRGSSEPKGVKIKRVTVPNAPEAKRPETRPQRREETGPSPEVERGQSISQSLLQGAAMIPSGFKGSQILQGLFAGAGTGMQIDNALQQYRERKRQATAANAAVQMTQPVVQPPTPSNVPSDVTSSFPAEGQDFFQTPPGLEGRPDPNKKIRDQANEYARKYGVGR